MYAKIVARFFFLFPNFSSSCVGIYYYYYFSGYFVGELYTTFVVVVVVVHWSCLSVNVFVCVCRQISSSLKNQTLSFSLYIRVYTPSQPTNQQTTFYNQITTTKAFFSLFQQQQQKRRRTGHHQTKECGVLGGIIDQYKHTHTHTMPRKMQKNKPKFSVWW